MDVLCVFAVVFVVVTLAGHGIWVLLAWLSRAVMETDEKRPPAKLQPCFFCNQPIPTGRRHCPSCNANLQGPEASSLDDLKAAQRVVADLRHRGLVADDEAHRFLELLDAYRTKLQDARPEAKPISAATAVSAAATPPATVFARVVAEPVIAAPAPTPPPLPVGGPVQCVAPAPSVPLPRQETGLRGERIETLRPRDVPSPPTPLPRTGEGSQHPLPSRTPSLGELLAAFMDPHNIRWGEIIGGLLFIVGAAALVITQWQTLQQFRFSRFFIFLAATAAIFGLGFYAHFRWRLASTSRGLLTIATLLVPLNYLAMAGMSRQGPDLATAAFEIGSLAIFAWLVSEAGRILVPGGRSLHAISVLGGSIAVALFAQNFAAGMPRWLSGVALDACLPVACFAGATAGYLGHLGRRRWLSRTSVWGLFHLFGIGAFTLLVALGSLVVARSPGLGLVETLHRLSLPLAVASVPILVAGLTVFGRTRPAKALGGFRTAGAWLALLGAGLLLATLGLAWPQPATILAVAALGAATLAAAARVYRMPVLHAGAIACLSLAYFSAYQLLLGHLPDEQQGRYLLEQMVSAENGLALLGLIALLAGASELLARHGRHRDGLAYAIGAGAVALASLLLVTAHGFYDGGRAALTATAAYGIYALASLATNARYRRPALSGIGLALLTATAGWWLWWQTGHVGPVWALVFAALGLAMCVVAAVLQRHAKSPLAWDALLENPWRETSLREAFRLPLAGVADGAGLLALILAVATAVLDADVLHHHPAPLWTCLCLAAAGLLSAWNFRRPERTLFASAVIAAGLFHTLVWNYTGLVPQPGPAALLVHAALALVATLAIEAAAVRWANPSRRDALRRVFAGPLADTAFAASCLVPPLLLVGSWNSTAVSLCLFALAAVWLAVAWTRRWPALWEAHRVVLAAAVLTAVEACLERHAMLFGLPLTVPWAYGIGLALLSLAWVALRVALGGHRIAGPLLGSQHQAVDVVIKHALVVAQAALLLPGLAASVLAELGCPAVSPPIFGTGPIGGATELFGPDCWLCWGILTLAIALSLWQRFGRAELAGAILLSFALAALAAGTFASQSTLAAALRWNLAIAFLIGSALIWQRRPLRRMLLQAGAQTCVGRQGAALARSLLVLLAVLPVVALTLAGVAALVQGLAVQTTVAGPLARIAPMLSYLVPLGLLALGLVGHALRERSDGYAFSAGLIVELGAALAYVLFLHAAQRGWHSAEWATGLELPTLAAAAWAIAWLLLRRRVAEFSPRTPGAVDRRDNPWLRGQLALATAGIGLLLGVALALLILAVTHPVGWIRAAGSPLGAATLGLTALAAGIRRWHLGRRPSPHAAGWLGMATLGLLACAIQVYWPEWGYRSLMLGWGSYALLVALCTWWAAALRTPPGASGRPQALIAMAAAWVRVAGLATVLLGLKAALWHDLPYERLWAAAAITLASAAGVTMAVWQRREDWAFLSSMGVHLAASLVVWHFHRALSFDAWWMTLVEANAIAGAAVALLWIAARRRLLDLGQPPRSAPATLLGLQVAIGVAANALLWGLFAGWLFAPPTGFPALAARLASVPGVLAMLLAAAAAAAYLRQNDPRHMVHVAGASALAAALMSSAALVRPADWSVAQLYLHAAMAGLAAAGLVVLAAGFWLRSLGRHAAATREDRPVTDLAIDAWVCGILTLAAVLAVVHNGADPQRPWWSAGTIVAASAIVGLLARYAATAGRQSGAAHVYVSGLLLNLAGMLMWQIWGPQSIAGFLAVNALCLAVGALVSTGLGQLCRLVAAPRAMSPGGTPLSAAKDVAALGAPLPYAHMAAVGSLILLAPLPALSLCLGLLTPDALPALESLRLAGPLAWSALALAAAAMLACLGDRTARFPLWGLYLAGLTGVGIQLSGQPCPPLVLAWQAVLVLAPWLLLTAVVASVLVRLRLFTVREQQLAAPARWSIAWYQPAQAALATVVTLAALWIALDVRFDAEITTFAAFAGTVWSAGLELFRRLLPPRMAAPLALAMLFPATLLIAGGAGQNRRAAWRHAAIGLATLVLATAGWAWLSPANAAPWLHRSVILMVAALAVLGAGSLALMRWVPQDSPWSDALRRGRVWLGQLAVAMLALALVEEGYRFLDAGAVPMARPAICAVGLALLGLAAAAIVAAVVPVRDPLALGPRQRTLYVYAAEALLVVVGLHLRLTVPELFTHHIIERYGLFIAMGLAFGGAGLSEIFRRRKLDVLAEPLERTAALLPVAPMAAFWFVAHRPPWVWLLIAAFYGTAAFRRRSTWMALLSAATANVGLWVLLEQQSLGFLDHLQLWLIPPAMAALVAEHQSRGRLSPQQSGGLRYLALSVIYLSSTADMFLAGLGNSVILPMSLLVLAALGILLGMALRVRTFLYLGTTFLLVVVGSLVEHLAVDRRQTWLLWVCIILLGAAIIALFAVFEKRRNDVVAALERFRQWQ